MQVLVELDALNARLLGHPLHPLLKSGSLHASLIRGGQELSSYPASCVLQVERRTVRPIPTSKPRCGAG